MAWDSICSIRGPRREWYYGSIPAGEDRPMKDAGWGSSVRFGYTLPTRTQVGYALRHGPGLAVEVRLRDEPAEGARSAW